MAAASPLDAKLCAVSPRSRGYRSAEGSLTADFHCLDPLRLERFLERRRAHPTFPLELSLAENLMEVLRRANSFVPSAAGSILLDDPSGNPIELFQPASR